MSSTYPGELLVSVSLKYLYLTEITAGSSAAFTKMNKVTQLVNNKSIIRMNDGSTGRDRNLTFQL